MAEDPPRAADVKPLDVDGVAAVTLGIVAWTVSLIVVLVTGHRGEPVAICGAGIGLGFAGMAYVLRRRAAYRRDPQPENLPQNPPEKP
jgi:predicted membrane protein